jgi:glycosyltransferase involved in cell wall biosynthesis
MARIFLGIRQQMEAELWLIGEGPEMQNVVSILQQGQVEDDVRYCGLQPYVAPLLAQGDLLLMTSLSESFCLAALESMACKVPVLATRVGGLPEVVVHGETGFLFPVGDHDVAVSAAVNLLSNSIQHQLMCVRAGQYATKFSDTKIVPAYEKLYQRLLSQKYRQVYSLTAARDRLRSGKLSLGSGDH